MNKFSLRMCDIIEKDKSEVGNGSASFGES